MAEPATYTIFGWDVKMPGNVLRHLMSSLGTESYT